MPYVKNPEAPFAALVRCIQGYCPAATHLADAIHVSASTARSRLKSPDTITLGELRRISQRLHIPKDELLAAIKF